MFRWLALCLVLCAGAFALVALATGKLNPLLFGAPEPKDTAPAVADAPVVNDDSVQPTAATGLGRGGAIVLAGARLTPVEREDAPSQHDGTIFVVGTDDPADPDHPGEALPSIRVPFLVLQVDSKDPNDPDRPSDPKDLPPEDEWLFLVVPAKNDSRLKEAVGKARAGDQWEAYKKSAAPLYRRWHEGDPLKPHKVEVAFEEKVFHKVTEGDWVKKGQLLALVDPTVQVNDVSTKVAKMETAEADYQAAIKTKEEAIRRASSSELLWSKGKGYISEDDYRAALLNRDRYIEEEKSKDAARKVAGEELSAALSILQMYEVRASIPGVVKTVYKHRGESVKNLDPVVQIVNPLKLRVEGLAGMQDAQNLLPGMTVVVEPVRPKPPAAALSGHQGEVTCVAVGRPGADGRKLIVSGSEDGTVRFWDWTAAQPQLAKLETHTGVLAAACTGPKAERNLALVGDREGVGRLIDLDRLLPEPAAADAAVGPAARLVQAPPIKLSERHKGPITCVAFSPDGKVCATGGEDRCIRLWNAANGNLIHMISAAHKAAVTSLQFAQPDGQTLELVSAGGDETLCVWDLKNPEVPTRAGEPIPYRSGDVAKLGVSADGKYVLFDHDDELRVLSLETRQTVGVIRSTAAGADFTTTALFAPDGNTILTNSASDGRLQLWRAPGRLAGDDPGRASQVRQFVWMSGPATCAAFDPDDKQTAFAVTGSRDGYVLVWAMPKADEVLAPPLETRLTLVERSLDSGARQVRVWADLRNEKGEWLNGADLTPGCLATMVVPAARPAAAK